MKSRRSQMTHQFSQVPKADIQRSSFDRSHSLKTTFNSGYLVPIFVDEALPGDSFNLNLTAFSRLATPINPYIDNLFMETFFFAVPYRLIWRNWERFNGAQDNPTDSTDFAIPQLGELGYPVGGYQNESLADYFGLPTHIETQYFCSSLPFRAYNLIYNEWFRDQNLQDSVPILDGDSSDSYENNYTLLRRGKRHDYFTSALPFAQKGDPVSIPLGGTAPIRVDDTAPLDTIGAFSDLKGENDQFLPVEASGHIIFNTPTAITPDATLYADLTQATAVTINSLRQAFQIQKMFERDARGGTRYTELILSHFLVSSPDSRLQRPEYLGGGSSPVIIQPVAQTSPSAEELFPTPQGNLAGYGTATLNNHGFNKSFTEHCIIIGLINVRADLTYQNGLDRMWSRTTRFDFYWPALAHLGEQSILNKEIYLQGTVEDVETFGFQERYAEYRYKNSMITGKMRSNDPQTLDSWHLAQEFDNLPLLNAEFIVDEPPVDRIIAVPSEPQFILDVYFKMRCARPMPLYGVPGFVDRF